MNNPIIVISFLLLLLEGSFCLVEEEQLHQEFKSLLHQHPQKFVKMDVNKTVQEAPEKYEFTLGSSYVTIKLSKKFKMLSMALMALPIVAGAFGLPFARPYFEKQDDYDVYNESGEGKYPKYVPMHNARESDSIPEALGYVMNSIRKVHKKYKARKEHQQKKKRKEQKKIYDDTFFDEDTYDTYSSIPKQRVQNYETEENRLEDAVSEPQHKEVFTAEDAKGPLREQQMDTYSHFEQSKENSEVNNHVNYQHSDVPKIIPSEPLSSYEYADNTNPKPLRTYQVIKEQLEKTNREQTQNKHDQDKVKLATSIIVQRLDEEIEKAKKQKEYLEKLKKERLLREQFSKIKEQLENSKKQEQKLKEQSINFKWEKELKKQAEKLKWEQQLRSQLGKKNSSFENLQARSEPLIQIANNPKLRIFQAHSEKLSI